MTAPATTSLPLKQPELSEPAEPLSPERYRARLRGWEKVLPRTAHRRFGEALARFAAARQLEAVDADPWLLTLWGIVPWEFATWVARQGGIEPDQSSARLGAAIRTVLVRYLEEGGHLAMYARFLLDAIRAPDLVPDASQDDVNAHLRVMLASGLLVATVVPGSEREVKLAVPEAAEVERNIAQRLLGLLGRPRHVPASSLEFIERELATTTLTEEQRHAIRTAFTRRLTIVTGAAGTGKTVIIREMTRIFAQLGEIVHVATPTGKAAEVLQLRGVTQAATMHSLMGITPDATRMFDPKVEALLMPEAHRVIIDEGTMPDAVTYDRILRALPERASLVIFGDADQLPSVGPGAVMEAALSASDVVPVCRITLIQRTNGRLTENGNKIRRGIMPVLDDPGAESLECAFFNAEDVPAEFLERARAAVKRNTPEPVIAAEAVARWIVHIASEVIPARYGDVHAARMVQVITPQAPGPLGTWNLNALLRDVWVPESEKKEQLPWFYGQHDPVTNARHRVRVGDSVIATDTLSDEIRNGAVGTLVRVANEPGGRSGIVRFDRGVELKIKGPDFAKLMLRYALTVDKMQGSECPFVIQVVHSATNKRLATRRRLYTGYTRARKASIIVGEFGMLRACLDNEHGDRRVMTLPERLRGLAVEL